jgi:hypothetical protein
MDCWADVDLGGCSWQPPSFFSDAETLFDTSARFNPVMANFENVFAAYLDFTDGELVAWHLLDFYQFDTAYIVTSFPGICDIGRDSYDCSYVPDSIGVNGYGAAPGKWVRSPPVAPVPIPAPFALLLGAVAMPLALRFRRRRS